MGSEHSSFSSAHPGLDLQTLTMGMTAQRDFVAASLPYDRALELDDEDVCPEDIVRADVEHAARGQITIPGPSLRFGDAPYTGVRAVSGPPLLDQHGAAIRAGLAEADPSS